MWSGLMVGISTQASATLAVYPPSRPTMPRILAFLDLAKSRAATRLGLTFFSRLPPPTDNTRTPSRDCSRLVRSQLSNIVGQPSSLVRAVNSDTLSVGA